MASILLLGNHLTSNFSNNDEPAIIDEPMLNDDKSTDDSEYDDVNNAKFAIKIFMNHILSLKKKLC